METKRRMVVNFLRKDLKIQPNSASYSPLNKALNAVLEDESNFVGITTIDGDKKRTDRNLRYFIEVKHRTAEYKKIVGSNTVISPKEFIIKCYDFIINNYL